MREEIQERLQYLDKGKLRQFEKLLEIREHRINFAKNHHRNMRLERMRFRDYPHIRALYEEISPNVVLMGATQTLKSEVVIIDHLASAYCGLNVFFVLPNVEMKSRYVQTRVDRVIDCSEFYSSVVHEAGFGSLHAKSFGKGVITYVGSNAFQEFVSQPCDKGVIEEVDQCKGEHLPYIDDRMEASPFRFKIAVSNPTLPNMGIHKMFLESDQKEWHLPCSACGKFSECSWFDTVVKPIKDSQGNVLDYRLRDTEWQAGGFRDIYMICPHCEGRIHRESQKGKWVPKKKHHVSGYHISSLCSLLKGVSDLYLEFRKAQIDDELMRQFYVSRLGVPRSVPGSSVATELLDSLVIPDMNFDCSDSGYGCIPGNAYQGECVMGMDIGASHDAAILYVTPRGKKVLLFAGKLANMREAHDLASRFNVQLCVVDQDPETTMVTEFQEDCSFPVWLCRYRGDRIAHNHNDQTMTANKTLMLDKLHQEMRRGKFAFPKNFRHIQSGAWLEEMTAAQRELVETGTGKKEFRWEAGKSPDHSQHALSYAVEAARIYEDFVIS